MLQFHVITVNKWIIKFSVILSPKEAKNLLSGERETLHFVQGDNMYYLSKSVISP